MICCAFEHVQDAKVVFCLVQQATSHKPQGSRKRRGERRRVSESVSRGSH